MTKVEQLLSETTLTRKHFEVTAYAFAIEIAQKWLDEAEASSDESIDFYKLNVEIFKALKEEAMKA